MSRVWQVGRGGLQTVTTVAQLQQLLLTQRGITAEASAGFFSPSYADNIHDPLLLHDMARAVDRLYAAIEKKERIIVHGDYDADGISSTAILVSVLQDLGAVVAPHLPHRSDDGYGLNKKVLAVLAPEMDVLIAVDCGISSVAEVAYLKKKHIDTIIIDHHTVPTKLPAAYAVVHPRHPVQMYTCQWLCGAGLSFKVAQALLRDARSPWRDDPDREKWLLDMALLGTIADVVPLQGENRALVRFGLEVLKRTKRPGLQALLATTRTNLAGLSGEDVAFRLVPRLNAAGRMAHPQPALDLLLADSAERAQEIVTTLNQHNSQRQTLTKRILREAELQAGETDTPIVFAADRGWPAGVVGLAAGRLADKFGKPAVVVGSAGDRLVGSARSGGGFNILQVLQAGEEFLVKLGGHAQAAGFTVRADKLLEFRDAIMRHAATVLTGPSHLTILADALVSPELLQSALVEALLPFAPYGEGNKQPAFIIRNLSLAQVKPVGKEQKHARFLFRHEEALLSGIGFGLYPVLEKSIKTNTAVDVLGSIEHNEFRGQQELQLKVRDVAPAGQISISEIA